MLERNRVKEGQGAKTDRLDASPNASNSTEVETASASAKPRSTLLILVRTYIRLRQQAFDQARTAAAAAKSSQPTTTVPRLRNCPLQWNGGLGLAVVGVCLDGHTECLVWSWTRVVDGAKVTELVSSVLVLGSLFVV